MSVLWKCKQAAHSAEGRLLETGARAVPPPRRVPITSTSTTTSSCLSGQRRPNDCARRGCVEQEVKGIGAGRQKKIAQAWKEQAAIRELMIYLHGLGVGGTHAQRIYKAYGNQVRRQLRGLWVVGWEEAQGRSHAPRRASLVALQRTARRLGFCAVWIAESVNLVDQRSRMFLPNEWEAVSDESRAEFQCLGW